MHEDPETNSDTCTDMGCRTASVSIHLSCSPRFHLLPPRKQQSLNCLSNTPKLFDLKELLSSLKITPGQMGNMKGLIYIEGLTEKQVRQKLSHAKIIGTNRFGINSCLYYIFFEDVKGRYLCLFNGDRECFRALFFSKVLLN